jgi:hypothetical protein
MKKIIATLILAIITVVPLIACDITLKIDKEKKKYKAGDEVVVKVTVVIIHRNCKVNIKNTQYKNEGLDIVSGTEWKETSPGTWERKLKVKITGDKGKQASLTVFRTCELEGGTATQIFKL